MDQSEKVGLGVAVGGHALLLALLVFGLFQAAPLSGRGGGGSEGEGIAVSIVSEAGSEAPAPGLTEDAPVPDVQELAEVLPDEAVPDPIQKSPPKQAQKQTRTQTPATKDVRRTGRGNADLDRRLKDIFNQQNGGNNSGNSNNNEGSGDQETGDGPNATQIALQARATIAKQIKIGGCMPSGVDVNKVTTRVTVRLAKSGALVSITEITQSGQTAGNRAQLEPIKRCIVDTIKAVRQFTGLDPKTHSAWEYITVPFKSRG